MNRPAAALALLGLAALLRPAGAEENWAWGGPLRYPDAHPFQAMFLDTPALDAALPARPTFDFRVSHFNTMTVSRNVSRTPAGLQLRGNAANHIPQTPLNAASLAASAAQQPDQTFLFADTESSRLDFTYTVPVDRHWGFAVDVPIWGHLGGVFDQTIDGFHRAFNFPAGQHALAPVDRCQIFVAHGGRSRFYGGSSEPSLGDVTVRGLFAPVLESRRDPAVMLSAAVKLPTGPASRFLGSGGWEWGLGLHLARSFGHFRGYFTLGRTWHERWSGLPGIPLANTFDLHFGGELRVSPSWSLLADVTRQEHALAKADPPGFGRPSYLIGVGFRRRAGRGLGMEGGFFENLSEDANSYDVGLHYRLLWSP